jgi:hypothetical protein
LSEDGALRNGFMLPPLLARSKNSLFLTESDAGADDGEASSMLSVILDLFVGRLCFIGFWLCCYEMKRIVDSLMCQD